MTVELDDPALRARAIDAAQGAIPFDLLLEGGTIVDVATGELRPADVGIVGPLIASVHERGRRADALERVACRDRWIAPGLIDSHMHIESSMVTPRHYADAVLPQGTTTIVWDPHDLGNILGLDGVRWAIAASADLPLRVLVLAPSCVPSAPGLERSAATFGATEMAEMLSWPRIVGVAEVMNMQGVIERSPALSGIVQAGLASGKLVCGHARGLVGPGLQAYAAAGIASDHEITSGDDLLAKLRAGLTIELRGSHDYLLPEAVEVLNRLPQIPSTVTLCTDDVFPDDLVAKGGMNDLIRRLIGYGMAPVAAYRAATLNAALRLRRSDLGLVAPGRRADIVVLDDLETAAAGEVIVSGRPIASQGQLTVDLRPDPVPLPQSTMTLDPLPVGAFRLAVPEARRARLHVIEGARFTRWASAEVDVVDGHARLPDALSLMAVVHRHGRADGIPALAPLADWGRWQGALATSFAHDSHNLNVFGREPEDMAAAANAVIASDGGMAVAREGRVIASLALPVAGVMAATSAIEVAAAFRNIRAAADSVAEWKPPYRVFKACTGASLACNAGPHLTDLGLTDGGTRTVIGSAVERALD